MTRWQRYWFAEGGRTALALVRIAVAVSVLLTLARLDNPTSTGDLPGSRALYRPVGLWMLLGHAAPPDVVVRVLWALAWTSTLAMLVGAATRVSTAVSCVAVAALAALSFSASLHWSHQYNVVLLAQIALLGARSGDTLSLDAAIRHVRGLPPLDRARAYQWSLRLVQLAVALMFASAFFHKLVHGHFTLRWALSDNLRHQLLIRFDLAGLPRPPLVDWLIDDPWRYRTAAMLNLVSQAAPLAACFLMKRPVLRALAGTFFVIETLALGFVVDLWNLHWLPLAAVFVDWERLLRIVPPPAPGEWRAPRGPRIFIAAFLAYDLVTAFIPALDQQLNTYPFSGFPMFAIVQARPPYGGHQPWDVASAYFEVTADRPLDRATQLWFDHANRGMYSVREPGELKRRLTTLLAQAQRRYPDFGVHGVRLWLAIYEAPAYPAPAHFERHPIAVLGEIAATGEFRTLLGKLDKTGVVVAPDHVPVTSASLVYYRDDNPAPIPLAAPLVNDHFDVGVLEGNPIYFVAIVDGTPWLVATRAHWVWN